jgi:phenylacetate-CoA oxygenase PaaJ subunit
MLTMLTIEDLGILRSVDAAPDGIVVAITPTYSGCPAMREIGADVRARLNRARFEHVTVATQLVPAWSSDWITTEGRRKLAAAGIAPPSPARHRSGPVPLMLGRPVPPRCPRCGSPDTRLTAQFSATACKSLHRCDVCGEPFPARSARRPGSAPRIGVREVAGGVVSGWLARTVKVGDTLEVQVPSGTFTPDLSVPGQRVLIAVGSGITPTMSIAASVLAADEKSTVALLYGNRRSDTVMVADEVADLKDAYPARMQIVHVLSREPQEVELHSGRLDAARLRALLPVPSTSRAWTTGGCAARMAWLPTRSRC